MALTAQNSKWERERGRGVGDEVEQEEKVDKSINKE